MTTTTTEEETANDAYVVTTEDLEMLIAAYPEEIAVSNSDNTNPPNFTFTFLRDETRGGRNDTFIEFETSGGGVRVRSFRHGPGVSKTRMEGTVRAVRAECVGSGVDDDETALELLFRTCRVAMETWEELREDETRPSKNDAASNIRTEKDDQESNYDDDDDDVVEWITGEILTDRKSTFQAHLTVVTNEDMVRRALVKLLTSSTKIQRATHNMYAYRFRETVANGATILKHDNDDDGEDGAGSKMAHLLEMRNDDGVLVVVSRWFGGIHLGPKRFAHIVNVARELLVTCHKNGTVRAMKERLLSSSARK